MKKSVVSIHTYKTVSFVLSDVASLFIDEKAVRSSLDLTTQPTNMNVRTQKKKYDILSFEDHKMRCVRV